jgi:DNA-binding transcriptional MerR regulator
VRTAEVAKLLELSTQTVRRYADIGVIPCRVIEHPGGRRKSYLFLRTQIEMMRDDAKVERKYEIKLDE